MNTLQTVRFNHHRRRWRCSGIFFVLFVSNFLVHYSECHGNLDTEIVLKPHVTSSDTDLYYRTQFYQPKNATQGSAAPAVPWEDALKHTAFLTLNESQDNANDNQLNENDDGGKRLEEALRTATMQGFDQRPVPQFGDIVMLAMGTLEQNKDDHSYAFVRSKNICNEDDQIDINCLRKMPSNISALWSVQKVRHRDDKGNYRFELRFGIITMDSNRRHRIGRENQELPLRQFVAKQEDYPMLFNGQFSDSDLRKRSDFFEDAQPSINQEVINNANGDVSSSPGGVIPAQPEHYNSHYNSRTIDRTIFDLLPFFGGDDDEKSHHPNSPSYYTGGSPYPRQPHSIGRPVSSPSEFYSYFSHPAASTPYRPVRPRPAYPNYSPPSFSSLFNPIASGSYVRPVTYKHPSQSPEYARYPDSTYSYSSPFKSYAGPPAQYHYMSHHHPGAGAGANSIQSSYQTPGFAQMFNSFNPISYFLNRNRPPTVGPSASRPQIYYQRSPFADYKPAETQHYPKKALYYTNVAPAGYEFSIAGPQPRPSPYKESMNGAYSVQSQKYVPLHHQQVASVVPQVSVVSPQQSYYQHHHPSAIPSFSAHFPPSAHPSTHSGVSPFHSPHQLSNPFVVQHLQMVPIPVPQQQHQPHEQTLQSFQPQIISQVSIPLTATTFRFPQPIPLHDPETVQPKPTPKDAHLTSQRPQTTAKAYGKDLFEIAREPKQRSKFSDPDPLYHSNAKEPSSTTISTTLNKIQATPKISYFFPKDDDNSFQPHFPVVPASTVRRNFTESEFKHVLQQPHQHASYQKLNNFLVTHGKGGIIYATPSSLPVQAAYVKKPPTNIIYGQVMDGKVQPPTHRPEFQKEVTRFQVPAPSKGTHQTPPVSPAPARSTAKPSTTPKRVTSASTPINLITPPSTTASSPSSSTTTMSSSSPSSSSQSSTTRMTTSSTSTAEPPSTPTITQRNPRGRHYSRSKATTTTTEKPVLKWMPKRKRPKHEPSKISTTLNNSGTTLPKPHISNRTRISAQASAPRAVVVPLDDVSMGPEEMVFQRRHEKYVQATSSPSFAEKANGIAAGGATNIPSRNKKRKNHVHHEYSNFVTVPTTTARPAFQGDEAIPEPQKNVFTTTSYPTTVVTNPAPITTFTSRSVASTTANTESAVIAHTLERDVYTTSVPHFLPTVPATTAETSSTTMVVPAVPMELFELSKAQVKAVQTDTPDVELFRASPHDEAAEEEELGAGDDDPHHQHHDDDNEEESNRHDNGEEEVEEEEEDGLDFIAKSIVAHAKKVFSDASSNTINSSAVEQHAGVEAKSGQGEDHDDDD